MAGRPGQRRRRGLVRKDTFANKACSKQAAVSWVLEQLRVSNVKAEDCPSAEAWSLYQWAKMTPDNESAFITSLYAKLLPSRQQLEREERHTDDAEAVQDLIDQVRRTAERARDDHAPEAPRENGELRPAALEGLLPDFP